MTAPECWCRHKVDPLIGRCRRMDLALPSTGPPVDDGTANANLRDDVLVVLPTYNEAENLESIAEAILSRGPRLLIVDDDSPDGTGDIADRLARHPRVDVLHRPAKSGLGRRTQPDSPGGLPTTP